MYVCVYVPSVTAPGNTNPSDATVTTRVFCHSVTVSFQAKTFFLQIL